MKLNIIKKVNIDNTNNITTKSLLNSINRITKMAETIGKIIIPVDSICFIKLFIVFVLGIYSFKYISAINLIGISNIAIIIVIKMLLVIVYFIGAVNLSQIISLLFNVLFNKR